MQEQEQHVSALQEQLQKSADEVAALTLDLKVAHSSLQVKQAPITLSDCDVCEGHGCICSKLLYCTVSLYIGYAGHRNSFCMAITSSVWYCALSRMLLGFVAVAACRLAGETVDHQVLTCACYADDTGGQLRPPSQAF